MNASFYNLGRRFCVAALSLCVASIVSASLIPDMKFRRLDTRDGLSSSQVNCILRDSQGYMWFCTPYGLNRYDGYRFRTFFSYEKDTTTMRTNRVDRVEEAHDGRLWLDQGMSYSVYDPKTEKFDRTPVRWLNKLGIKGGLESVHIDKKKNYWVKTYDDGFYYYNPTTKNLKRFHFGYGPTEFTKDFAVQRIAESKEGMVLVSSMGELICLDGEQGKVLWKEDYVKRKVDQMGEFRVYIDPNDNIWCNPHSMMVYVYDKRNHRWYNSFKEYMDAQGFQGVPDNLLVWDMCYDAKGYLWVATDHQGALVFDFKNHEWRQFITQKGDDSSLPDITIKHFYLDQLGRMWVATYKNGVCMCSDALSNFASLAVGDINGVCEDNEGYYWLGHNDGGISRMDPNTREVVEHYDKHSLGLSSDIIVSAFTARDGSVWFGSYEGGLIMRTPDGQWKNYRAGDPGSALSSNNIWNVTEDKWGNMWIGVLGGGVVLFDRKRNAQRAFNTDNSALKTIWTSSVQSTPNDFILVGNTEYYALINPGNFKITNGVIPQGNNAHTISPTSAQVYMDSRGLIWQCSPTGVAIYDRKTGQSTLLDIKSGLYGSNAVAVCEDKRNTMWVVTDHGISNIIPQRQDNDPWTFTVRSYNERDGLQPGPFNQRAICCTKNGLLLIGGQEGVDIINTQQLKGTNSKERPIFSGLELFNLPVDVGTEVGGRVLLKKPLNDAGELNLKYDENQFTILMASDNGEAMNTKRFIYQLEGFNDQWIKTKALLPEISYMSLRYGDYVLHVRMLGDDGMPGEVESTLKIHISQPFWRARWALLAYMLIVLAGAWWWRKLFLKKQQEKMRLEALRRNVEKQQWMQQVQQQMQAEAAQHVAGDSGQPAAGQSVGNQFAGQPVNEVALPPLHLQPGDLVPFLNQLCSQFVPADGPRANVRFLAFVDSLPMTFDRDRITQAVSILLNNSAHFSPAGSKIKVFVDAQADKAVIRVSDTGIGIPDEVKDHVFDAYTSDGGADLSLHLVKTIVEAHHGTIEANDNPGGGTVFVITLPTGPVTDDTVEEAILMDDEEEPVN